MASTTSPDDDSPDNELLLTPENIIERYADREYPVNFVPPPQRQLFQQAPVGYLRGHQDVSNVILNMQHVREEAEESGEGDSSAEAAELECFDSTAEEERLRILLDSKDEMDNDVDIKNSKILKDIPSDVHYPKVPTDFVHTPKTAKGEPMFPAVDNPGGWNPYYYRAKFKNQKKEDPDSYIGHFLPTGAKPVPIDPETGKRVVNGWEFFYQGEWKSDTPYRNGATSKNLFPEG